MAANRFVYNQVYNVSISKKDLIELIAQNDSLSKKDLRVCLVLFTKLDGYRINDNVSLTDGRLKDPLNYNSIDIQAIADTLDLKKKDVKNSIDNLIENDIIQEGSSNTVTKGYRFTF